jgi:nitroreductase
MDVKEAISKRRSIRKYQRKEVSLDLIRELVDAARQIAKDIQSKVKTR